MIEPTPAERSVARAEVADSADRSALLWLRSIVYGTTALVMAGGAIFLALTGVWVQCGLALAAAAVCLQRLLRARREERRVFARAVEAHEEQRKR